MAIGPKVVYYARAAAHALSAGIKCRHCSCICNNYTRQSVGLLSVKTQCSDFDKICLGVIVLYHALSNIYTIKWKFYMFVCMCKEGRKGLFFPSFSGHRTKRWKLGTRKKFPSIYELFIWVFQMEKHHRQPFAHICIATQLAK